MAGGSYLWSPARDPSLRIDVIRKCFIYFPEDPKDGLSTPPRSPQSRQNDGGALQQREEEEKTSNCPGTFLLYPSVFQAVCSASFPGAWSTFTSLVPPASGTSGNLWGAKTGSANVWTDGAVTAANGACWRRCWPTAGQSGCCFVFLEFILSGLKK